MRGNPAALDFIAYYIRGGQAVAACAIGRAREIIDFLHCLDVGRIPSTGELYARDHAA